MIAPDPGGVRRILIRANNWIGDVVMISPAVRAIRERFARARIAILAKRWVLDTLEGSPFFDDLIEYDSEGTHRGLAGRWRLARGLRRRGFDLAVLFQKAFDAAALAALAGIPVRVGYATDRRAWLLTHPLPPPSPGAHHQESFLGLARALGCPVRDPAPSFHVDAAARSRAVEILAAAGLSAAAPLVALHPGASKPPRGWHAGRFAALARGLCEREGAAILLIGGAGERPLLEAVGSTVPPGRLLLPAPDASIKVVGALLERCHLFVGNDSGPMHIAAALGTPTVAIFGPGSPRRTAPYGTAGRVIAVTRAYPCSPCRQDFFRECPPSPAGKPFCLEEIDVEEVRAAALSLLGSPRAEA